MIRLNNVKIPILVRYINKCNTLIMKTQVIFLLKHVFGCVCVYLAVYLKNEVRLTKVFEKYS